VGADPVGIDVLSPGGVTRIDLGDPHGIALTLDPLEPEPGFPVTTHASLLSEVWCAAERLPSAARDVLTLALLRAYEESGWDCATGRPLPGATVPALRELTSASEAAADELRCDDVTSALIRGFVRVRLGELCGNGAGMFFAGGHRLGAEALLGGNVEVVTGSLDHIGRALVAGTVLLRLTERARLRPPRAGAGPVHILAIDDGELLLGGALESLIADAAARGERVLLSGWDPPAEAGRDAGEGVAAASRRDLITGRRTAACGRTCDLAGPCTRYQIRTAVRLAASAESEPLREWAGSVVVAFLMGRPLSPAPERVRRDWAALRPRLRECLLATIVDEAVTARAVIRELYQPAHLAAVAGRVATALLEGRAAPARAGQCWVLPQLRWVHEAVRAGWAGPHAGAGVGGDIDVGGVDADDMAPPLDFAIDGLADWPGIRAGQRLALLLRHPLSAELPRNRRIVALILGEGTAYTP
jgi:hypothetical protein